MRANLAASLILVASIWLPAQAQQFEPRPGIDALSSGATGVFEIGAVDIDRLPAVLRALVHNGQLLQVHSKRTETWLAKRSGSLGGKSVAPTALDELAVIAGGVDTDVRCQPAAIRAEFARVAGVVMAVDGTSCPVANASPRATRATRPPTAGTDCSANGCRIFRQDSATRTTAFTIEIERESATWRFVGYGIIAVWGIPES
jgi:hypothetical protein